ncbi:MAG TPA: endonuclease/exonuclease/phosphatase family protein [Solirubrobacteraceae bacterium]|jgi:hypothetical protein|nr:endonuclease/exonuclease/phosphatase family protein [Solirubrobacteraceae bacterium]
MTKILCWNVNNFSTNGFYPGPNDKPRSVGDDGEYDVPAAPADAKDRREVLLGAIEDVEPDIVVIIEVQPGKNNITAGELVADTASYELLQSIRKRLLIVDSDEFCLVPPLVCGVGGLSEGVAVYYRWKKLQFLGPYGWAGIQAQPVDVIGGPDKLGVYHGSWGAHSLPNREVPDGWPSEGCREDRLAGQFAFTSAVGAVLKFPEKNSRTPWLTMFRDIAGKRLIKLLSYHAPPDADKATSGIAQLAAIPEITTDPLKENEVRCIVGDFNVSTFDPAGPVAYDPLKKAPASYIMRFDPAALGAAPPHEARGYYLTALQLGKQARPWISDKEGTVIYGYPAFDYMGDGAIDNAFTRHGGKAGAASEMTVCNPVTKSPYKCDPDPPKHVLQGTYKVQSYLTNKGIFAYDPKNDEYGIDGGDDNADDVMEEFRKWENYTHIRSTSDHLPIALDV